MKLSRIAPLCVALLGPWGVVHCEPSDQFSPPATPQNATATVPPPPSPPPAPAAANAETEDGANVYASGEVAIGTEREGYEDDDPSALSDFRSTLEPHGAWVDDPTYGTAWVPSATEVGADFRPYVTAGHWVYDDDWVWVSDYDWGWAPFHYGRWAWIDGRGWAWIPGRQYRGAWVVWGVDDGYSYVGWAPMPPAFVWFGGLAVVYPAYVAPRWVYCPRGAVFSSVVRTRVVEGTAAAPIAARVRPYVPATPGVSAAGPPPQRLGFQAAQVPRASGATAAGVVRAQQFARPATAQGLGAQAPTRTPVGRTPVSATAPHAVERAPRAVVPGGGIPATASPARPPAAGAVHVAPTPPPVRVAPASRSGPSFRGGGGHR